MKSEMILSYIRKSELKRLFYPAILLLLTLFILSRTSALSLLATGELPDNQVIYRTTARRETGFVREKLDKLYYTGQDYWNKGNLLGHYYYALLDGTCQYYIINAETGVPAEEVLENYTVTGRIEVFGKELSTLNEAMAAALTWYPEALRSMTSSYYINETDYLQAKERFLILLLTAVLAVSLIIVIRTCVYWAAPRLTPAYRRLRKYGNPEEILAKVEEELYNSSRIRTRDMVLTASYLLEFSADVTAIIPLEAVLWTYDHASMRYTLRGKTLSYTIHVVTIYGDEYNLKKKSAEDVQVIYNELTSRFPNYFYGYSREHQQMVRHIIRESEKNPDF